MLHGGGAHVPAAANGDVARGDAETPGGGGLSRESSASGCGGTGEGEGFRGLACEEADGDGDGRRPPFVAGITHRLPGAGLRAGHEVPAYQRDGEGEGDALGSRG